MLDLLMRFVLEELAMSGPLGASPTSLQSFIELFYNNQFLSNLITSSSSTTSASQISTTRSQTIDSQFLSFVWESLKAVEDVRVGVLVEPPPEIILPKAEDDEAGTVGTPNPAAELDKQGSAGDGDDFLGPSASQASTSKVKGKSKAKGKSKVTSKPKEEGCYLRELDGLERDWAWDMLVAAFGEKLRLAVGEEESWVALTGSFARPTSLTPTIYAVLQMVAKGRNDGMLITEIAKEMDCDPKSCFHYVRVLSEFGLVKKFRALQPSTYTNRVIHTRYLPTSQHWQLHLASKDFTQQQPFSSYTSDGEGDEEVAVGGSGVGKKRLLSARALRDHKVFVEKKIRQVLKGRNGGVGRDEVIKAIGLLSRKKADLQALDVLIDSLVERGIVESLVDEEGGPSYKLVTFKDEEDVDKEDEEEEEVVPQMQIGISLEKQAMDLVLEADAEGLINYDLRHFLSQYPNRFIDHLSTRLCWKPPSCLSDHAIVALSENLGREKRTRWFSQNGYWRRCERDGFFDQVSVGGNEAAQEVPSELGGWADDAWVDSEEFFVDQQELEKWYAEARENGTLRQMPGSRKGHVKEPLKKPKGPRGRPRKQALPEGKMSYYDRRKKEDAERKAQGLPPRVTVHGNGRGKSKKLKGEEEDTQEEGTPTRSKDRKQSGDAEVVEETPPENPEESKAIGELPKNQRGRPPKVRREDVELVVENLPGTEEARSTPPSSKPTIDIPKRKRGRPPKIRPEQSGEVKEIPPQHQQEAGATPSTSEAVDPPKKKRGRPSKVHFEPTTAAESSPSIAGATTSKKRKFDAGVAVASRSPASEPGAVSRPILDSPSTSTSGPGALTASSSRGATKYGFAKPTNVAWSIGPFKEKAHPAFAVTGGTTAAASTSPSALASTSAAASASSSLSSLSAETLRRRAWHAPAPLVAGARQAPASDPGLTPAPDPLPASATDTSNSLVADDNSPRSLSTAPAPQEDAHPADEDSSLVESGNVSKPSAAPKWSRKKPQKVNISSAVRQKQVMEYIQHCGGIIEHTKQRTTGEITEFFKTRNRTEAVFTMDRGSLATAIGDLAKRDVVRKTTVFKGIRHDLVYLSDIELAGEQMLEFQANLPADRAWRFGNAFETTNTKPDSEATPAELRDAGDALEDRDAARDYFRRHPAIGSATNGLLHGRFARARAVHKALADIVFAPPSSNSGIVSAGNIFHAGLFTVMLPLGVYLQALPVDETSPRFKTYIANEEHLRLRYSELPRWVRNAVPTGRKSWRLVLPTLVWLNLITPVAINAAGDAEDVISMTLNQKYTTHYRLNSIAPVYACNQSGLPLVGILPLTTVAEVEAFWDKLEDSSLSEVGMTPLADSEAQGFPTSYSGPKIFPTLLSSRSKWRPEYTLLDPQRRYLRNLIASELVTTPEQIAAAADDVLAPLDAVQAFLDNPNPSSGSDRKNKRRKLSAGDHQNDSNDARPTRSRGDMSNSLRQKALEAHAQRERDFTALVDRFSRSHGNVELSGRIFDYVHKRFCSKNPVGRFSAQTLEKELELLLPGAGDFLEDGYKSIVPTAVLFADTRANPFSLPAPPRVVRRRNRVKAPPPPPTIVEPAVNITEFLTQVPRTVPHVEKGRRLPRNMLTSEQQDLCLDGAAIVKARAERLHTRVQYGAMAPLFEGLPVQKIRNRFVRIIQKPEDAHYYQRLTAAWVKVWERHKDELVDPHPNSMTDFDITACVRTLRANVDKKALRLAGPSGASRIGNPFADVREFSLDPSAAPPLPGSVNELKETYHIEKGGYLDVSSRWSGFWRSTTSTAIRESDAGFIPHSAPCHSPASLPTHLRREVSLVVATIKTVCATPADAYVEQEGEDVLAPLQAKLELGFDLLVTNGVVTRALTENRRAPGRNFALSEKFLSEFDDVLTLDRVNNASKVDERISTPSKHTDETWPIISDIGDMLALIELVSDAKVELSVDTAFSSEFRDPSNYETRKADDEWLENNVLVHALEKPTADTMTPHREPCTPVLALAPGSTDDAVRLDAVLAKSVELIGDPSLARTLDLLLEAGDNGIGAGALHRKLPNIPRRALLSHLQTLTSSSPPLAFYAGDLSLVIVASHYLRSWTITNPHQVPEVSNIPVLWRDLRNNVVPELWKRAAGWVKSLLSTKPGANFSDILSVASTHFEGLLLTSLEIFLVLETLVQAGSVSRKFAIEGTVDWERDRFFLTERWYVI